MPDSDARGVPLALHWLRGLRSSPGLLLPPDHLGLVPLLVELLLSLPLLFFMLFFLSLSSHVGCFLHDDLSLLSLVVEINEERVGRMVMIGVVASDEGQLLFRADALPSDGVVLEDEKLLRFSQAGINGSR